MTLYWTQHWATSKHRWSLAVSRGLYTESEMDAGAWNTPIENWPIGLTADTQIKNLRIGLTADTPIENWPIGLTGNTLINVIIPLNSFSLQSKKRL